MKTLLLLVALLTPVQASAMSPADCKSVAEFTVAIMDARRAGVSVAELLQITDQIPGAVLRLWAKRYVVDIYSSSSKLAGLTDTQYADLRRAMKEDAYVLCTAE